MKKVVFDTNVWVSALAFHGRVRRLREEAFHKRIQVAVSNAIIEETARVLGERKFKYSPEEVAAIEREIRELAHVVRPVERLNVVKEDPDDDRVLECAVESGAEIILSGDRHLLDLGSFRDIRITDPATFLGELESESGTPSAHEPPVAREQAEPYGLGVPGQGTEFTRSHKRPGSPTVYKAGKPKPKRRKKK